MELKLVAIVILFTFGASFTQRVTGFGFGIFIMTVLPYILPTYGEATALSGMLGLFNVLITFVKIYRYVDWRKLAVIIPTFIVVSFFCVRAVSSIDSHMMKFVLGGMLILVSIYFFAFSERIHMKPSVPVQIGMGALSGITGGFFAIQGPPAVIYFLSCTEDKQQYLALISAYFIISNLMMTGFRAMNGLVTVTVLEYFAAGVPAVLLGLWFGRRIHDRMPIASLRKVVYAFMAVSGVLMLIITGR